MLRGPQTTGEIRGRAGKQFNFPTMEAAQHTMDSLLSREVPYIEEAPRVLGQKETRYRHKFYVYENAPVAEDAVMEAPASLRQEITQLQETLRQFQKEMNTLRNVVTGLQGDVMMMKEDLYPENKAE